jgi:hypothetical protein
VRGDEVVSLGWCFWHRGCFGCLVCGARVDIPDSKDSRDDGTRKREWGRWDGSHEERRRGVGVELESIPMCDVCGNDTDGTGQYEVLKRGGLETVSKFDGGLGQDQLPMLSDERDGNVKVASKHFLRIPRRLRGGCRLERDLKMFINGSSGGSVLYPPSVKCVAAG